MEAKTGQPLSNQFLAGAGFALIYALMQYFPLLAALGILALLPCVLLRVDDRQRRIALAPLTFAGLMLTQKFFLAVTSGIPRGYPFNQVPIPWLPLFLSVCLYYMPEGVSWSRKAMLALGVLVLLSGLLPGTAFVVVFWTTENLLFVAVAIALGMDFFGAHEPQRTPGRA